MGWSCCLLGRRATAVGVAALAERERPASCDVAKPKEALRAAAGMAKNGRSPAEILTCGRGGIAGCRAAG